jgi:hypothetical protein
MFNPTFTTYQPQQLIIPNKGNEGWKTIGTGMKIAGGLGSWLDSRDRAKRMNEAQENWYNTLSDYIDNANPKAPAYTDEELANYSEYLQNKNNNEQLLNSLESEEEVQELNEEDKMLEALIAKYRTNPKSMTRDDVKKVQMLLDVKDDGIWGPITNAAASKWENL